jgi:hypothetical protein
MYPEKPNLVDPRKISNGSYAAGIVLSDEMQQTLNQTQCRPQLATPASFSCCFVTFFLVFCSSCCNSDSCNSWTFRKGPIEKYSGPVTEAQEIGWFNEELVSHHDMMT